jgi:nucleosome binding factor SPN SPT16 subunit
VLIGLETYLENLLDKENGANSGAVRILIRDPKADDHEKVYSDFFSFVKGDAPKVGVFGQDKSTGKFAEEFSKAIPAHF